MSASFYQTGAFYVKAKMAGIARREGEGVDYASQGGAQKEMGIGRERPGMMTRRGEVQGEVTL
jgi:hypothetical protein